MSRQTHRLPSGGRIDRVRQLGFTFDGVRYTGHPGDTLASALLANGVRLIGRSFKYHRPRGIFTAGVEEPTGLATLRSGGRTEPNAPMPMVELYDGLAARSQNCWPSPRFDVMAVNDWMKPLLAAGFYYKTFMGPTKKSWMLFEPFIRRAAGLGAASTEIDPDRYEKVNDFCDVLVVGSGPAGLAAALAAGRMGARVLLAEQYAHLGGQLGHEPAGSVADNLVQAIVAELRSLPKVRIMTRTTVFGAYDGGTFGLVERVADHKPVPDPFEPRQRTLVLRCHRAVIAAGALERPIPFGQNDRPGVMLASAVRAYLNRYGVIAGRRAVVFTNNNTAYETAQALRGAGAAVTVVDARPGKRTPDGSGIAVIAGHAAVEAVGGRQVEGALIAPFELATGRCGDNFRRIDADLICVSGGHDAQLHLATQRGIKAAWSDPHDGFLPASEPDVQSHAGAMRGTASTAECLREGFAAGARAAARTGYAGAHGDLAVPDGLPDGARGEGYAQVSDVVPPAGLREKKRFIDFQNDVSASDVKLAHLEGYVSVEHLKRYTTLGMATEQGKISNVIALAQMAKLRGTTIPEVGTTGYRAPYTPVALAALAGHETDAHLRPVRRTPFHAWNERQGAVFLDTGLWKRPWYYPAANGEEIGPAYRRETAQVRKTVGMVDVSTLGKIDVQGPDAAELLNRVYVNGWSNLEVGKCRYGIMLREDGYILDDGTTTRIAEHHYFLTTTTAEAVKVMAHLEWLLQTAWPDLKVHVTSVTDQWGGVAIAGPNARALMAEAIDGIDFSDAGLPYMGFRIGTAGGIPVRVHRLSFSGELAYEVFCGAGHGAALCDHLVAKGVVHGLVLYGVEALGALRIEKGHVAGVEIDGRTTLDDLGLERMASKVKPFVGSVLRQRPEMTSPERQRLVGLRAVDASARIRPGMILQPHNGPHEGHGLGHVTSTTYSPQLRQFIALGLVQGGMKRRGEIVDAVYPLKGDVTAVEIVSPHFFDPEGKRLHG